jgi:hypothetical protein
MREDTLVRARHGLVVRVLMTTLLVGMSSFFGAMAVLVSHDSALVCRDGTTCQHVERYPFGVVNTTPLAPLQRADVKWDTGGRAVALKLVLRHADGQTTEYQGVGKNGDRAEDTAAALNAWLSKGQGEQSFALREGSWAAALFLALLAVLGVSFVAFFFSRVRVTRTDQGVEFTVERWPARPRRLRLPLGEEARVVVDTRVVRDQWFFSLWLERGAGPRFELGLDFRTPEAAAREQDVVAALLR